MADTNEQRNDASKGAETKTRWLGIYRLSLLGARTGRTVALKAGAGRSWPKFPEIAGIFLKRRQFYIRGDQGPAVPDSM